MSTIISPGWSNSQPTRHTSLQNCCWEKKSDDFQESRDSSRVLPWGLKTTVRLKVRMKSIWITPWDIYSPSPHCWVMTCKPNVSLSPSFNVPFCVFMGRSSSDAPLTSNRTGGTYCLYKTQNRRYKTNVQNSQQIILGSKTVWEQKEKKCTWKN